MFAPALPYINGANPFVGLGTGVPGINLGAADARLAAMTAGTGNPFDISGVRNTVMAGDQATQQLIMQCALMLAGLMANGGGAANQNGANGSNGSSGTDSSGTSGINGGSSGGSSGGTSGTSGNSGTSGTSDASGTSGTSGSGDLKADSRGKVSPADLKAYIQQKISSSKLNGFKPRDGAAYGVDGSPGSWANFMTKLCQKESDFKSGTVGDVGQFRGGSRGLFQLSYDDAKNYKLNGGRPFTAQQLADPKTNVDAAIAIMESLVTKNGSIQGGAGKYWGPIKRGWKG